MTDDGMDFYNAVTGTDVETKQYELEHEQGHMLVVDLEPVERKQLLDEIARLPDDMLDALSEAEDEDEAQEMAENQNMLSSVNGDTVDAFENICVMSMSHSGELTEHHFEKMVPELDFEVLFEIGAKVIELSFENQGSIKDFHEADTDKNS